MQENTLIVMSAVKKMENEMRETHEKNIWSQAQYVPDDY